FFEDGACEAAPDTPPSPRATMTETSTVLNMASIVAPSEERPYDYLPGPGCIPTFLYTGAASGDDRYLTSARAAAAFFACDDTNATSDVGVEIAGGSGPTASTPGSVRISLTNVRPISTSPFASASMAAAPPRAR